MDYRIRQIRQITEKRTQNGFSLVEVIAALAIIAILASLSLPRFITLDGNAKQRALHSALSELNAQEKLLWSKIKLSDEGWVDDTILFSHFIVSVGPNYKWAPPATATGGNLFYQEQELKLIRIPSTATSPGKWNTK